MTPDFGFAAASIKFFTEEKITKGYVKRRRAPLADSLHNLTIEFLAKK